MAIKAFPPNVLLPPKKATQGDPKPAASILPIKTAPAAVAAPVGGGALYQPETNYQDAPSTKKVQKLNWPATLVSKPKPINTTSIQKMAEKTVKKFGPSSPEPAPAKPSVHMEYSLQKQAYQFHVTLPKIGIGVELLKQDMDHVMSSDNPIEWLVDMVLSNIKTHLCDMVDTELADDIKLVLSSQSAKINGKQNYQ